MLADCSSSMVSEIFLKTLFTLISLFISGYLLKKWFVQRANASLRIEKIIETLATLEEESLAYWNTDAEPNELHPTFKEQKIKSIVLGLMQEVMHFRKKYANKNTTLVSLIAKVSDTTTGGNFESSKRKADRYRYFKINNAIQNLKIELLDSNY